MIELSLPQYFCSLLAMSLVGISLGGIIFMGRPAPIASNPPVRPFDEAELMKRVEIVAGDKAKEVVDHRMALYERDVRDKKPACYLDRPPSQAGTYRGSPFIG